MNKNKKNLPKNDSIYLIFDTVWGNTAFWFDSLKEANEFLNKLRDRWGYDIKKLPKPQKFTLDF